MVVYTVVGLVHLAWLNQQVAVFTCKTLLNSFGMNRTDWGVGVELHITRTERQISYGL